MSKVQCWDVVEDLINEASKRFKPLYAVNEEKLEYVKNVCKTVVVFDAPVTMQPKNLLWETDGKVYYRTESNLVSVEKKLLQKKKRKERKIRGRNVFLNLLFLRRFI